MHVVEGNAEKHRMTYVVLEVINSFANNVFASAVAFALYATAVILVAYLYAVFKFTKLSFLLLEILLVTVCVLFALIYKAAMTLAVSCHTTSRDCCMRGLYQIKASKETRKFWKSRRPTSIYVGRHFVFDTNEYVLNLFGNIILHSVIDLLLTF